MRLAHLADLHLGFRQYERQNQHGADVREADVGSAFERAIDDIVAAKVDAVLVAGDLFHAVRPPNSALIAARQAFRRLAESVPTVIVPGNHETPRSRDTTMILGLYAQPGLHLVAYQAASVRIGDLNVGCYPHIPPGYPTEPPVPDPSARWNVMLAHLAVDEHGGAQPWRQSKWDYVALGDYHVAHEVEPGVWYSGSLEYVSSNPWGEMAEQQTRGLPGKGWLLVELTDAGPQVAFRPVATRAFIDLPLIDAVGRSPGEIDLEIASNLSQVQVNGSVIRQVVRNLSREVRLALKYEAIREVRQRALHFHLDLRRPLYLRPAMIGARDVARAATLEELMDAALDARSLSPDLDLEALKAKAHEYLRATAERTEA